VEGSRAAGEADIARIVELALVMRAELSVMRGGELWLLNHPDLRDNARASVSLRRPR